MRAGQGDTQLNKQLNKQLIGGVIARLAAAVAIGAAIVAAFDLVEAWRSDASEAAATPPLRHLAPPSAASRPPTEPAAPPLRAASSLADASAEVSSPAAAASRDAWPAPPPANPRRLAAAEARRRAEIAGGGLQVTAFGAAGAVAGTAAETAAPPPPAPLLSEAPLPMAPISGEAGFALVDLATGATLSAANAATPLIPASVAKIPTAYFALAALGPEHRFETRLLMDGGLRDGVVRGDLILQGGGDPALDTAALAALLDDLVAAGVRRVEGRFLYDTGPAPEIAAIEPGQPLEARYNPGVSGLNLNFNRVLLRWTPRKGAAPIFEALVDHGALSAPNVVVTPAPPDQTPTFAYALLDTPAPGGAPGPSGQSALTAGGAIEAWSVKTKPFRRAGRRWLPVRRPGQHAAEVFRGLAALAGVSLPPPAPAAAPRYAVTLARSRSEPLAPILRGMLKYSTNLTAEVIGVAASRATGADLSAAAPDEILARSGAAMVAWLADNAQLAPDRRAAMRFANHSGLSTASRLSAGEAAAMLAAIAREAATGPGLPDLMPRYRKAKLGDRATVRAKTGTMFFGRGLAGYLLCASGRQFAFAFFNSDLEARARFDALMRARHVTSTPEARRWLSRARAIERRLLTDWTAQYCA